MRSAYGLYRQRREKYYTGNGAQKSRAGITPPGLPLLMIEFRRLGRQQILTFP